MVGVWAVFLFFHYFSLSTFTDFSFLGQLGRDGSAARLSQAWGNAAAVLPAWLWDGGMILGFWAWGGRLRAWLGLPEMNRGLTLAVQGALGVIFFNGLWLGLGLNGLWFEGIFLALSLGLMALALWDLAGSLRRRIRARRPLSPWPPLWVLAPVALGFFIFLLALAHSLTPEIYFDGLVYHLSVPQYWIDRHGILSFSTNFHSNYPFGSELYLLNGFWVGSGEGAKGLNVAALLAAVLALAGWVAEESGAALGLLTGAGFLFLPWVSTTVWTTQNEVILCLFLLLFFHASRRWAREPKAPARRPWALAMGLWGGAALGVKYTAAPAFAALLAALWVENRRVFARDRWKEWLVIQAIWLASLGPWLLKTFCYTGNPVYPYFARLFGGLSLSPQRFQELMGNHESLFGSGMALWRWPLEAFHHMDKTIGPLFLAFIPFWVLGRGLWKKERYLLTLGLLYLDFGFLVSFQPRLLIPEMAVFLAGTGCFLGRMGNPAATRAWALVLLAFGLTTFLSLGRLSVDFFQAPKIWFGVQSREAFLSQSPQTASYYPLARACGRLAPRERVLVVGDARGLYYPRPFLTNSVFDEPQLVKILRESPGVEGLGESLRRLGVDDLVFSRVEEGRLSALYPADYALTPGQAKVLGDFIRLRTSPLYQGPLGGLYRLKRAG